MRKILSPSIGFGFAALGAVFLLRVGGLNGDVWWHIAVGHYIVSSHHIIRSDVFAYTEYKQNWIDQSWLYDIVIYLGYIHLGTWFAVILPYLICLATLVVIAYIVYPSSWLKIGSLLLYAGFAIGYEEIDRPQSLAFLFIAILVFWLSRKRLPTWTPLLFFLWANLHGSFIEGLGFLIFGIAFGVWERKRSIIIMLFSTLVTLINPYGIKLWKDVFVISTSSEIHNTIQEWLPLNFHNYFIFAMFIIPILLVGYKLVQKVTIPTPPLILFVIMTFGTMYSARILPYYVIAFIYVLYSCSDNKGKEIERKSTWLLVAFAILYASFTFPLATSPNKSLPIKSTAYIKEHHLEKMHIYNEYMWGGYLDYVGISTFIDGRTELFLNKNVYTAYLKISTLSSPLYYLNKYHVQYALLAPKTPLATYLLQDKWQVLVKNKNEILLKKT